MKYDCRSIVLRLGTPGDLRLGNPDGLGLRIGATYSNVANIFKGNYLAFQRGNKMTEHSNCNSLNI